MSLHLIRVILFVLFTGFCWTSSVNAASEEAVAVEVEEVHFSEYARPVKISGILTNKSRQTLAFKVPGVVYQVFVDEGQRVRKGQLLARLNPEEADAEVAKANSVLVNAEKNLERFRSLQGQNALSVDQLQAAETRVEVARSDLKIARFNRRHAEIRAPGEGRILSRTIEPNELVQPGQPGFVFAAEKTGWVLRTGVTDKDIVRLTLGDKAELHFDAYPGVTFHAVVSELAARADDATKTFETELRIEDSDQIPLFAGFVGHGKILPSRKDKVALLPLTAVLRARGKTAEGFILDDQNQVHLRTMNIAFIESGQMAVIGGLEEGEEIVVRGAPYLHEDSLVNVQR